MTHEANAESREAALDRYLETRTSRGFMIETRSSLQAVIVRRHKLYFLLCWFARDRAKQRFVVSVDQHGEVTSVTAQPVRW